MSHIAPEQAPLISEDARARLIRILRDRLGSTGNWHSLSHSQDALWFLWQLAPESWAYNIVFPFGVRGPLDVQILRQALRKLSDRHACLRIEFKEEGGETMQRARPRGDVRVREIDASGFTDAELHEAIREQAQRPFDLKTDATLRVALFHRSPTSHVMLLALPHIVSDLWSFIVLIDELRDVYFAEKTDETADLKPLGSAYEDYVRGQRRMLDGEAGEKHWQYWREELAGEPPVLDLPTDHARPPMQTFRGASVAAQVSSDLTGRLKALAADENVTLFMALLAAFQVLLHRYSGQDSVIVGAPTSGRHQAEFAGVVGDFVNMVPLRADFAGSPSFRQVLAQSRGKVVGAIKHQDFPFSLLVERLQPARDLSRSPIFQASFVLQQFHRFEELSRAMLPGPDEPTIPFGDLTLEPWPFEQQEGQFDVSLEMKEDESGRLMGSWKYATDLFDAETIGRMAGHFETLLGEIVADPACLIDELPLLSVDQRDGVIAGSRGRTVALPAAASVCELFEAQAARRADTTAVVCGDTSLSYGELALRVGELARRLAALDVGPDVVVAILLPRGFDFVAVLLATSKVGGAFLPLDPRHPLPRTAQILDSGRVPLVLTSATLKPEIAAAVAALPQAHRPRVIAIEELPGASAASQLPAVRPGDLAYIMYTSGSTGSPKGVMVEHRGMVNHVLGKLTDLGMGEDDALAQNAPQSFDVVVWQSLAPLAVGGRVVIMPDEIAEDSAALLAEIEHHGVTVLQVVPSMLRALIEEVSAREAGPPALRALRWMVPTGEALPTELCRRWWEFYPHIPVLNTYGSTECSDDQCHYRLTGLEPQDAIAPIVSIGAPIHNMAAYVLDRNLAPVSVGVVGELYIGGIGVGRGYRDDPTRTAACFVPDPFSDQPGARLYKTRDLVRRRKDGTIDFLGRVDHMIKLRGLRIEPGEIETALCRHPHVAEAAVIAHDHPSRERQLVAYVVAAMNRTNGAAGGHADADDIRRFLGDHLPQYMVPASFCFLDALPLTANGKLDLRRLPAPQWQAAPTEQYVAPRAAAEETMAGIWAAVLGRDRVSVTADFFAIGGDSILSIQIASRCRAAGLAVHPTDIFMQRTIAALVARLDEPADAAMNGSSSAAFALPSVSPEHLKRAIGQVVFDEG